MRPLESALQGSQLVTEGQILKDHVVVAPAGQADRTQKQQHKFEHGVILSGMAGAINSGAGGDQILANDTSPSTASLVSERYGLIMRPATANAMGKSRVQS